MSLDSVVRPREVARSVTPLELLFDLVYVFAISALSANLILHLGWRGIAQTLVLTLAAMYAWFMTVWTSNWLDVERRPVQLMLLGLMFASLLMSTSIGGAFGELPVPWVGDRAALFVVGYLAIQLGRTTFAVAAFRDHRLHDHFVNALVWEVGTAAIWIAGVFANGDARLAIWALAVVVTYGGVIAGHPLPGRHSPFSTDSQIYAEHLLERFRLFFLIALGETVLTIGGTFAGVPIEFETLAALVAAFLGTVSLWWCQFHRAERLGVDAVQRARDASRIVAVGNYALIAMVLGIVAIAVGDELALADPSVSFGDRTTATVLVFGGPALFLLAQLGSLWQATGAIQRSRALGCAALLLLAIVSAPFNIIVAVACASAVLLTVAISDTRGERPQYAHRGMND
jgi:low temperature requirement protein LtrA